MHVAFTGPRRLTETEAELIRRQLKELQNPGDCWHVGDAPGADEYVEQGVGDGPHQGQVPNALPNHLRAGGKRNQGLESSP